MQDWFRSTGAYAIVDGQYGSTGKGLIASYLAHHLDAGTFDMVVSNAGPNSGHTFYFGDEKYVLRQMPTYSIYKLLSGHPQHTWLSHGAQIVPELLLQELSIKDATLYTAISPRACLISDEDVAEETLGFIHNTATTGKGGGAVLARKVRRDPGAVVGMKGFPGAHVGVPYLNLRDQRVLLEVSQGFSLGLNQSFYPKVTSRECTVAQAFSDACISPRYFAGCVLSLRTFPIRVGNLGDISSGGCYPDQKETSWDAIGQPPEMTTVTKRVRRVFTWSWLQFIDALRANTPTVLFLNFMNYLKESGEDAFIERCLDTAHEVLGYRPKVILGYGPKVENCLAYTG